MVGAPYYMIPGCMDISGGSRISLRWGRNPGGPPTCDFAKFPQILHEIERILTPGLGGGG